MATVLLSQRRILRSSLTGSVVTQRSNHSCVLPSLVNAPVLYNSSLSFSTTKKGPRNFTVQPQLSPSSSTSSTFSTFTSIRDAAARAVVSQAIDRIASDKPKVNESTNISDKDMEYDALTWKSIVVSKNTTQNKTPGRRIVPLFLFVSFYNLSYLMELVYIFWSQLS